MTALKDVKGFIEINDFSFFLLISTIVLAIFIAYLVFKRSYVYGKSRCKIDCEKYFLYKLKQVDWSNPKKAAYDATYYGRFLATDKRRSELFNQMEERLSTYKYQKDVKEIDKEAMNYYNLYKQVCDESV